MVYIDFVTMYRIAVSCNLSYESGMVMKPVGLLCYMFLLAFLDLTVTQRSIAFLSF